MNYFWTSPSVKKKAVSAPNTYYVSFTSGDDGNTGRTINRPLKTLAAVNALSIDPGFSVLLKCGETWREQLSVAWSGSAGSVITIGSYGSGAKPKIYGSTKLTSWTDDTGHWKSALVATVTNCWFVLANGTIMRSVKQASKAACVADYDWYSDGNVLYIYSTADPNTALSGVEAAIRSTGVTYNSTAKNYITIDGLEIAFAADAGVKPDHSDNTNWTIKNNTIHHIGVLHGTLADGIALKGSNHLIQDNTIYETAEHGIYVLANNAGKLTNDCTVFRNTIYDYGHTGIDVMCLAGTCSGTIVDSNTVYTTTTAMAGSNGIQTQGLATGPVWVESCTIKNNVVYSAIGNAIAITKHTKNTNVFHNSCYGLRAGATGAGISINPAIAQTGIVLKNNACSYFPANQGLYCSIPTAVSEADNNLWFQADGGATSYAVATGKAGSPYHYNDQAAYKSGTGWDTNGLWADPLFVDPANGNLHLQADSICRAAGATGTGVNLDRDGVARPATPCIGAFEYVA